MSLSDHEQHVLDQMERALANEDPKLVSMLRGVPMVRKAQQSLGAAVVGVLVGIGGLIAGVATAQPAIGILGFLIIVGGLASALATLEPSKKSAPASPTAKKTRTSFMEGLEERWDRRTDN